jgi:hypothetical protein
MSDPTTDWREIEPPDDPFPEEEPRAIRFPKPATEKESPFKPGSEEAQAWVRQEDAMRRREFDVQISGRLQQREMDEYVNLRGRDAARERWQADLAARARAASGDGTKVMSGGAFLLDLPDTPPAVWGDGEDILWARGEALIIAGPQGVGKTTIAGQLLKGVLGLLPQVLGFPVAPCKDRTLYLAMDRPKQAQRALGRLFKDDDRDYLNDVLRVWMGPPPVDFAVAPEAMLDLCRLHEADVVFVDSIKDAAVGLSKDEVGAGYNRARQLCLAEGIEVVELHHVVKNTADGKAPNKLKDIYGSAHLTNGAGSVIMLWGEAGDPMVEFSHLKQPINPVGPFKIVHDQQSGLSAVHYNPDTDVLAMARRCPSGLSVKDAAAVLTGEMNPSDKDVEKARRELRKLTRKGLLHERSSGVGRGASTLWFAVVEEEPEAA